MANRQKGYGMTAELQNKKDAKWNQEVVAETMGWMKSQLSSGGEAEQAAKLDGVGTEQDAVHEVLKDGVLLCNLINVIKPGSVKKINQNKMAFKQMENIGNFLAASEALGCAKVDMFQTVDLYECQNMPQVINGISSLGRKTGRHGPKESAPNKREFTEEQLRAGDGVIGLQAGSNKGASQAGQNFGKTRSILD